MPLNITGVPLEFDVIINTPDANVAEILQKRISDMLNPLGSAFKQIDDNLANLLTDIRKLGNHPELEQLGIKLADLRKQQLAFQAAIASSYDTTEIQQLNADLLGTQKEIQAITNELNKLAPSLEIKTTLQEIKFPKVDEIFGADLKAIFSEAGHSFDQLDQKTQDYLKTAVDLSIKIGEVASAQKLADGALEDGIINLDQYKKATADLSAKHLDLEKQLEEVNNAQKLYQATLENSTDKVKDKKESLRQLIDVYENLTEAQRKSPEGESIANNIADLKKEIKGLEPGKIDQAKEKILAVETELRKLRNLMAEHPDSPLFNEWKKRAGELKESMEAAKRGIEQATNSTAGVEAFASGLRGLLGGYAAISGAIGLFTDEQEKADEITKNAATTLELLNGVQEISNVLSKSSALNVFLSGLARRGEAAATIATTAATSANTVATGFNTSAIIAGTAATEGAVVAQRALSAALLSNPAAILVAGVAALAVAYLALTKSTKDIRTETDLLKDANKKVNDTYSERMSKLIPLVELVKKGNLSEQQSIDIHKQLIALDPDLIKGLDKKSISYEALNSNVNLYVETLRKQVQLERNREALHGSLDHEEELRDKIRQTNTELKRQQAFLTVNPTSDFAKANVASLKDDLKFLTSSLEEQINITDKLGKSAAELNKDRIQEVDEEIAALKKLWPTIENTTKIRQLEAEKASLIPKRGTAVIDEEISALKKQQALEGENNAKWKEFQNQIIALEKEREAITGKSKSEIKKEESAYNKLLKEQIDLLQTIQNLQRDAKQSGLTKELSALDKINEKYDLAIQKVNEFNKRAPENLQIDTGVLNDARATETQNQIFRNNAENFKKSLDEQKEVFEAFEQAKVDIGEEKAKELFSKQIHGANDFLEFLKDQKKQIENTVTIGPSPELNLEQVLKVDALNKQIAEGEKKRGEENFKQKIADYKALIEATITFNEQRAEINARYDKLEAGIRNIKGLTEQQVKEKLAILARGREEELKGVEENIIKQSDLYKKLGVDILTTSKDNLKKLAEELQRSLDSGEFKDAVGNTLKFADFPELKKQVQDFINKLKEVKEEAKEIKQLNAFNEMGNDILGVLSSLGLLDSGLGKTLSLLVKFGDAIPKIKKSVEDFKAAQKIKDSTDSGIGQVSALLGIAGAAVGIFSSLFNGRAERNRQIRENIKEARKEIDAFYTKVFTSESEINALYRERNRMQVDQNKLRIQGLQDEIDLLKTQKTAVQSDFDKVLTELQKQVAVVGERLPQNIQEALAAGGPDKIIQITESLAGKSFAELERLFISGQLQGKAKELFEALKKLKDEGLDIDAALEENKRKVQELFAGTNADSITDGIIDGFRSGFRAVQDFAAKTEDIIRGAMLNALKYQVLQGPVQKLFEQFAADARSGGGLDTAEIAAFNQAINATIKDGLAFAQQVQAATGINLSNATGASGGGNLSGSIRGITAQQADLLAGQFGGLRITAIDQLNQAKYALNALNKIEANTAAAVATMNRFYSKWDLTGLKVI